MAYSLGLAVDIRDNAHVRRVFRCFLALPMLPSGKIIHGLQEIWAEAINLHVNVLMEDLKLYIENTWINGLSYFLIILCGL